MAGRGNNRGPQGPQLLNLERVPALAPKFANKIGKTCDGYAVKFDGGGITIMVASKLDANGAFFKEGTDQINLVEFERRNALHNQPSDADRLASLKRKFELRLEKEFPKQGPKSGAEPDIQAWLGTLDWNDRVALLKSQKDFEKSKSASK